MNTKTVLTGIKPTGTLHLGNLVGAIMPVIEMSKSAEKSYVFIADLHALNFVKNPENLKRDTYEIAASFMALGLDLNKTVLFRQSDIEQVPQLSSLLMNVTPKGLMNRAHSYKAHVDKNVAQGLPEDDGINMGLYTYPVLMAADILIYGADLVPVGKDQKQHVEFARDIANSFNYLYGKGLLKIPEPVISETGCIVPGFDGRKMSKSYQNVIPIFSDEKTLLKNIMKIKTDSKTPDEPKDPDESIIVQLYRNFGSEAEITAMENAFRQGGLGYGDAKKELFRVINNFLKNAREKYNDLMEHKEKIDEVLNNGAILAREKAVQTLNAVKKAMIG